MVYLSSALEELTNGYKEMSKILNSDANSLESAGASIVGTQGRF